MPRNSNPRPLVLLAGLEPIFQVGVARALADGGAEVIDETNPDPDVLVGRAAECGPTAIVIGDTPSSTPDVAARLRAAAPRATLVVWRTSARVAVMVPGAKTPRVMPAPTAGELTALFEGGSKGETCPST